MLGSTLNVLRNDSCRATVSFTHLWFCPVLLNEMGQFEELSHCKCVSRDSLQRGRQGMAVIKCQFGIMASMTAGCLSDRKSGEVQCEGLDACPARSHVGIVPPTSLLNPPGFWILARKVQRRAKEALPTSFIAVQELDMIPMMLDTLRTIVRTACADSSSLLHWTSVGDQLSPSRNTVSDSPAFLPPVPADGKMRFWRYGPFRWWSARTWKRLKFAHTEVQLTPR